MASLLLAKENGEWENGTTSRLRLNHKVSSLRLDEGSSSRIWGLGMYGNSAKTDNLAPLTEVRQPVALPETEAVGGIVIVIGFVAIVRGVKHSEGICSGMMVLGENGIFPQ